MLEFSESKLKQFNEAGFVYDLSLFLPFERNWNMKIKFSYLIGLLALPYIFQSCETDVDVLAPYEDISVVYGLLDEDSTRQYIKINKLFQTTGDANSGALDRDSQEYDTISGSVYEIDPSGTVLNEYPLQETEDVPKDSGLFYYPEQTLYYFDGNVSSDNTYELNFTNSEGNSVTASTNIVGKELYPIDGWESPNYMISFVRSTATINDNLPIEIKSGDNASAFEMYFTFRYRDIYMDDTESDIIEIRTPVGNYNFDGSQRYNVRYNSTLILNQILNNVPDIAETPNVKVRIPLDTCIKVELTYSNEELMYYMMVNEPSTSLSEEKPQYTNVNDGLGIFASRTFWTRNYLMNSYTHTFIAGEMDPTTINDELTLSVYNRFPAKGFCDNRGNPTGCN